MATRRILQGFGNGEDNVLGFPDGEVRAAALRSFDPNTQTSAIWWLDGRAPHELDVPVVGKVSSGVGTFLADCTLNERPIKVRFLWKVNPGWNSTWEQAFVSDGGATWEIN